MTFKTADLCDGYGDELRIAEPIFRAYGRKHSFSGTIYTVKTFEDNTFVRATLEEAGEGRVLVVDGGGSRRCALVGDKLASLAIENGWSGIIVNGCIRDSADIDGMEMGVRALATHPLKSQKNSYGEINVDVTFAGVTFRPGDHVYVDFDGIILASTALT